MNTLKFFAVALFAAMSASGAEEAAVSDVKIRQLWPWSNDIDIAFTVTGTNTAVKFTAQYKGVEPFVLPEKELTGDFFDAAPGRRHVRWSPSRAGLKDLVLNDLRITAEPDGTDRTYLVLNMYDGSYSYRAAPPEGGWLSDPANYQTNIVFRRIPKGTKTLGLPDDLRRLMGLTQGHNKTHVATLSSDYYMAVYPMTAAQHYYAEWKSKGKVRDVSDYTSRIIAGDIRPTYDELRGKRTDEACPIDWPNTEYAVAPGSVISWFRTLTEKTFSPDWHVDLPTSVQWEYAARAATPDNQLFSVGGVAGDSLETITNLLDQIATWIHNSKENPNNLVGQHLPNGWGLYDTVGNCYEWSLDWYHDGTTYYSGTDPVGPASGTYRCRKSSADNAKFFMYTHSFIGTNGSTAQQHYRLCIHIKSLFK